MFTWKETDLTTTVDIAVSLARYAASMLGNPSSIKCIVCDNKHVFARDIAVVLQNIDTKHPITQLICTCCEEYHEKFGCGTKSLLYLIGQWVQIGTELLHQGVPVQTITSTLASIIEDCIHYVDTMTFSVDKFLESSSDETCLDLTSKVFPFESPPSLADTQQSNITQHTTNLPFLPLTHPTDDVSWFFEDTDIELVPKGLESHTQINHSNSEYPESIEKIELESSIINLDTLENKNVISCKDDGNCDKDDGGDEDFAHCFDEIISFGDITKQAVEIKETQSFTKNSALCSLNLSNSNNSSTSQTPRDNCIGNYVEDYLNTKLQKSKTADSSLHLRFSRYFNSFSSQQISSVQDHNPAVDAANTKLHDDFKEMLILKQESNSNYFPSRIQDPDDTNIPDIWQRVKDLVQAFNHGAHAEIEDFVVEALKHQNKNLSYSDKTIQFNVKRLHTCCIQGPNVRQSEFVPGVVLPLHRETFCIVQDKTHSILLLNGDVCYSNSHIGYKKLAEVKEEYSYKEFISVSEKERWLEQVEWLIKNLAVTIIIARGRVDEDLKAILESHYILVFDSVAHTTMRALAYNTDPIVYILDASMENMIQSVTIKILNSVPQNKTNTFVTLSSNQFQVQTLVLCHATCAGLDVMEQEFWLCCHRVSSVLNHGKFLVGNGSTELRAAEHLEAKSDTLKQQSSDTCNIKDLYQAEILSRIAGSFRNYQCDIQRNSGLIYPPTQSELLQEDSQLSKFHILDDYHSKVHSWKRAVQLVCILLHTDSHIILGL